MYSAALDTSVDIRLDGSEPPGEPAWANYLRGVVSAFADAGSPLSVHRRGDRLGRALGGGLSSSAALEVATATLLEAVTGVTLDPREKARICRQAEHEFAGVPCGLMDQLASVMGDEAGALLIDCQLGGGAGGPLRRSRRQRPHLQHQRQARAGRRRLCAPAHRVRGGRAPAGRRQLCATPRPPWSRQRAGRSIRWSARRARHVTTENLRTLAAAAHLEAGEFAEVGALMYESHRSLRDDFEVSSAELDTLVDVAREIGEAGGVLGARMTGGGFGGCTVTLVRTEYVPSVAETLASEYRNRTGRTATTFVSRPARGAHLVDPLTVV